MNNENTSKSLIVVVLHVVAIICLVLLAIYVYEIVPLFLLVIFVIAGFFLSLAIKVISVSEEIIPRSNNK
jgi:hypothetical protein